MLNETLKELFIRDLNKLKEEISAYKKESDLWVTTGTIKNSGGNLCLHLIGNLNTYIGAKLGEVDYTRQRDLEFSDKDVPRSVLLDNIDETIDFVTQGLDSVTTEQLKGMFPEKIWATETKMDFTLIHIHSHLMYHLGQINYHRRMMEVKE